MFIKRERPERRCENDGDIEYLLDGVHFKELLYLMEKFY